LLTEAPAQDVTQSETDSQRALPSLSDLNPEQLVANLGWYQEQLGQYQQACHDWTVWGEEKTREVSELNEHLSYQTEAFRIKAAETEKKQKEIESLISSDHSNIEMIDQICEILNCVSFCKKCEDSLTSFYFKFPDWLIQ